MSHRLSLTHTHTHTHTHIHIQGAARNEALDLLSERRLQAGAMAGDLADVLAALPTDLQVKARARACVCVGGRVCVCVCVWVGVGVYV